MQCLLRPLVVSACRAKVSESPLPPIICPVVVVLLTASMVDGSTAVFASPSITTGFAALRALTSSGARARAAGLLVLPGAGALLPGRPRRGPGAAPAPRAIVSGCSCTSSGSCCSADAPEHARQDAHDVHFPTLFVGEVQLPEEPGEAAHAAEGANDSKQGAPIEAAALVDRDYGGLLGCTYHYRWRSAVSLGRACWAVPGDWIHCCGCRRSRRNATLAHSIWHKTVFTRGASSRKAC
mmetsp:Transcript_18526/g.53816  ORF Transcript_18526/g.53816 Transcript_18526/m.53816 type:complete len:238 (-) Transcript_18526:43-756(-)